MTARGERRIAIIGAGFAGSLLAVRLAGVPGVTPVLVEKSRDAGPGLAYGAAGPTHVLNVTVQRMEVGLSPSFQDWLDAHSRETAEAVTEAGELAQAFVPRRLFGHYMAERVGEAVAAGRIRRVRGEVTAIRTEAGGFTLTLADGRTLEAGDVVLATGHLPPRPISVRSPHGDELQDSHAFVPDPWTPGVLASIRRDQAVLLIGSGLTAIDVALSLQAQGHTGAIHLLSRHGLLPRLHLAGGEWPPFLGPRAGHSPLRLLRILRDQAAAASLRGIPWQRVMDAARPDIARIWSAWDEKARARFLRHGRSIWDVHRHRMPQRVANRLIALMEGGQLRVHGGRLMSYEAGAGGLWLTLRPRGSREARHIQVDHVVNCTGPGGNFADTQLPLFADLRRQGLIRADHRHLGIETLDTEVIDATGNIVDGLHALGSLTRPALWEITAVPDITAQVSRLVARLVGPEPCDDRVLADGDVADR